jgi:hypothetical protein
MFAKDPTYFNKEKPLGRAVFIKHKSWTHITGHPVSRYFTC